MIFDENLASRAMCKKWVRHIIEWAHCNVHDVNMRYHTLATGLSNFCFFLQEGRADWNVIVRFLHCMFLTFSDLMIHFTTPYAQQLHAWRISILQQRLVFFEPGRQCGELVLQGDLLVAPWKSMLSTFRWQKACRADWEFSSIALPQAGMEGYFLGGKPGESWFIIYNFPQVTYMYLLPHRQRCLKDSLPLTFQGTNVTLRGCRCHGCWRPAF